MDFTLTPYPVKTNPKSKYVIVVNFMHGDADSYTKEEYEFKTEEAAKEALSWFLEYSGAELGDSDYPFEIPWDVTADCQFHATIDGIEEVVYYNETGEKFLVQYA